MDGKRSYLIRFVKNCTKLNPHNYKSLICINTTHEMSTREKQIHIFYFHENLKEFITKE